MTASIRSLTTPGRPDAAGATVAAPPDAQPAGVLSLDFWRSYVVTMRPYLLFLSAVTGIAGMSLAPAAPLPDLLLLSLAFFLSYGLGQALTDCFQTDTDSLSSPYRPLVQGKVRRRDVMAVSVAGLVGGGMVLALYNPANIPLAALGIAGLATYTPFKRRWWAGPFWNAWIVVVLCLMGYLSSLGATGASFNLSPVLLSTLFAVLFGYANFVLAGYFKDVSADRATGYCTLPVVFGLRVSSLVSDVFAALTVAACGGALYLALSARGLGPEHAFALLFGIAGTVLTVIGQMRLHRVRSETEAHRGIGPVLYTYLLLLSALALAQEPAWSPGIILLHAGFLVTMRLRPMKQQI